MSIGSSANQRIGDMLTLKTVEIRGFFTLAGVLTLANDRMVVFQWVPNTVPVLGDIFQTPLSLLTSQFNGNAPELYKILWDSDILSLTSTSFNTKAFHMICKVFKDPILYFDPPGSTTGGNQLYFMVASDTAGSSNNAIIQARITYYDD